MKMNKTHLIVFLVGAFLGLCTGFFVAKGIYDHPIEESVTRDTVIVFDTIPQYLPHPVDSALVRYVTKFFPVVKIDTVTHWEYFTAHDTVAVEVPITSKHYGSDQYDAWVSGFEPSLDSIKVYQKEVTITEVRTISKPPNKWELDAVAGIDYNTSTRQYMPYAGGELIYKPNRLQVGIQGGVTKNNRVEPYVGVKAKYRIL